MRLDDIINSNKGEKSFWIKPLIKLSAFAKQVKKLNEKWFKGSIKTNERQSNEDDIKISQKIYILKITMAECIHWGSRKTDNKVLQ